MLEVGIWIVYILVFFTLAKKGSSHDALSGGKIGFFVQSFAYIATYFSAVALVGFGGLAYRYGLQMMMVALGNVVFGIGFVYLFFAWRTRQLQTKLAARTPAQLLARGHNVPFLRVFLGFVFALFLSIYGAAVIKGAAIMLQSIIPISLTMAIWLLVIMVGLAVMWGGLRGVLLTEAMQGCVMLVGIVFLVVIVLQEVNGPIEGIKALSALEATKFANNGFTSLSSGMEGYFIFSLTIVTSIAVWGQPQIIQRLFSLSSKEEIMKSLILAGTVSLFLVGGMYFISSLSRLILPQIDNPDAVIPVLVDMYLPSIAKQFFVLAVVSASLSTCTALFHIASSSLTEDLTNRKSTKKTWALGIMFCMIVCGSTAMVEGQFIALVHTSSWSVIGASTLVPYLSLILFKSSNSRAAAFSSFFGFVFCLAHYLLFAPKTRMIELSTEIPLILEACPSFVAGLFCSIIVYLIVALLTKSNKEENIQFN